jgi:hypothetical protein
VKHSAGATNDLGRAGGPFDQSLAEHLGVGGLGAWRPAARWVGLLRRVGGGVEQDRGYVNPRHAVDQAVVGLRDDRETVVLETVDEPHLPQRLRAIEALREHAGGEGQELLFRSRGGQRRVADVVVEVEPGIVDPARPALAEGDEAKLLAKPRDEVQAGLDVGAKVVERGCRALEERGRGHVHVRRASLEVQEGCVEAAEAIAVHRNDHLKV